ncbi:MAG: dipeptidase [Candidatus Muiribacteriota bacterium]
MYNFVDAHSDTFFQSYIENSDFFNDDSDLAINFSKLNKADVLCQTFAIFPEDDENNPGFLESFFNILSHGLSIIDKSRGKIKLAETVNDIFLFKDKNIIPAILSVEGAGFITSAENVNSIKKLGIKMISLTWNNENSLGYGSNCNQRSGLKKLGREVVSECIKNNIVLDVSHLNYRGFFDVAEIMGNKPFIASHSNCYRLCPVSRNLKDEQLKAIKSSGGVAGVTIYPDIVKKDTPVGVDDIIKHIDYICERFGVDYVGIGSDFDGIEKTPENLDDITCLYKIFEKLKKIGYSDLHINKIAGGNFLRVFNEIWGN